MVRITTPKWAPGNGATRAVALEVLIHGPLSRSDVARRLDLSPGSLTRLSTPLLKSGLLVEAGEQVDGRVGRPSQLLDVVPASRRFIGMKLMADEVLAVTTDLRARVLASDARRLPSREPAAVADVLADLARSLAAGSPEVTAIGIGIGGLVERHGLVRSAPFLEWTDVSFGPLIEARTGIPTIVDNDLVALTEYEHWFGAGRGLDRFAVVTLGAGVGYGLVIHDEIVRNDEFGIGLIGHWPLDPFGPVCSEGHRGCAKAMLTDTAIAQAVSLALGRPVTYQAALNLAASGEPAARRVVDDAGRGLGRLLAAIANLTMPEVFVIGGEGVRLAEVAAEAVNAGLAADRDPRTSAIPRIVRSGENIEWCRGAAVVAIQTFVLGHRSAEA
jgi:predicted NBD/HSP70 family sugar kinase